MIFTSRCTFSKYSHTITLVIKIMLIIKALRMKDGHHFAKNMCVIPCQTICSNQCTSKFAERNSLDLNNHFRLYFLWNKMESIKCIGVHFVLFVRRFKPFSNNNSSCVTYFKTYNLFQFIHSFVSSIIQAYLIASEQYDLIGFQSSCII